MATLSSILNECKLYIDGEEATAYTNLTKNVSYNITLVANDGFIFETIPSISSSSWTLDISTLDNKTYSGTILASSNYGATLTAIAVASEKKYSFNVEVTNATTNISPYTEYSADTPIEVTVTANEGYYFATTPTITYYVLGIPQTVMLDSDDTGEFKQNFYTTFSFTSSVLTENGIMLSGDAQVIPDTDKYGIITIYNPTSTELKQIGEVRYMGNVDLGNYISNLIKVYVKIPKGGTAKVLLGGYDTNVFSNVVANDIIETDCGTVEIVGNYNNAMDYENTTIELYLPLIGFQQLEPGKVMNETLSLIYKTNVINGDTIACIYNTTGTLLYTFNTNASFEIPYRLNEEIEAKGKLEVNSNYLFGFTPFVTVRYNKAYNTANVIANDNRETFIKDETGYIKCSEVFNTVNATATEKEEIENLLKEGVLL